MITPQILPTARPGKPGLTFFHYADIPVTTWRARMVDLMKVHDRQAADHFRSMMAREMRTVEPDSVRRQYLVFAVKRPTLGGSGVSPGLRALHDDEKGTVDVTHYRVIWFAEAVGI
jgi:hypothetical protein